MNVAPPFDTSNTNTWMYESGVDPAAIKDPRVRRAYEETILQNHQKNLRGLFEFRLKNLDSDCTTAAINYFKSAHAKTPSDSKELIGYLDTMNNDNHKTEMKQKLSDYVKLAE